jgi:hypothetical protein
MGSFVESAPGQHCKSTKITPAATAAGEAERSYVNAPRDQRAKASSSVRHCRRRRTRLWTCASFAAIAVICPRKDGEPGQHIAGVIVGTTTVFGTPVA